MTDHRNDPPCHVDKPLGGSGSDVGWSVEARFAYYEPMTIAGMMLDDRWRTIYFNESSPIGVPRGSRHATPLLQQCGLYDYAAAQALRWWFIAQARVTNDHFCVETRLIEHSIEYNYKHTAKKAHAYASGNDSPDWTGDTNEKT